MALILLSGFPADARGKLGGFVVSRNASGTYMRTKVSPVQPRSQHQLQIRAAVTYLSQYWRDTMTGPLRLAWDLYASVTPLGDVFGRRKPRKGLAMFLRANAMRRRNAVSIITAAPPLGGETDMQGITLTGTDPAGVVVTAISPVLAVGDCASLLMCKAPMSQARNYFSGPYDMVRFWKSTDVFPQTIVDPAQTSVGQRYFFQTRRYALDGRVGPTCDFFVDILV